MNKRLPAVPLLSALFLVNGVASRAWGPVGHEAVGMIAENLLTPTALEGVKSILGPGIGLNSIANCPDQFVFTSDRSCAGAFTMLGDPAETKQWHYINIPVDAHPDAQSIMDYCPGGNCVVAQIDKNVEVLKDPNASANEKQMALMFLVHFVGDVHQPLHGADGDPDDGGGNKEIMHAILRGRKAVNLHSVWDGEIDDPNAVDYHLPPEVLTARAREIAADPLPKAAPSWTASNHLAVDAALESHDIAANVIYPEYQETGGNDTLAVYQQKMWKIAHERIQMAGVRLAHLIEQAFAPAPNRDPNS